MNIVCRYLLAVAALALPAFGQEPLPSMDLGQLQEAMAQARQALAQANLHITPDFPDCSSHTARFPGCDANADYLSGYDAGMRALDNRGYDAAIRSFDRLINAKSARADGALYWKAYALNRLGKRDDALASIAQLQRDYPKSHWLNDAQALQVEVRQSSGKAVSPADESNDDIKLIAINGLMNADPDRAVPLLEGVLKGTAAPPVKDRAMFVLAQNQSPRAQQLLADYAKGSGNPDLQIRAVRYLGMAGSPERLQLLAGIYSGTSDASVKRAVVQALFIAGGAPQLVGLARKERDPEMKKAIVQQLSMMRSKEATDYMLELLK